MNSLSKSELQQYDKRSLTGLVVEYSQKLAAAEKINQRLERELGRLATELGAKNQKVLFAAQNLEYMQHMMFGRSSEKRPADDSPLFGNGKQESSDNNDEKQESSSGEEQNPSTTKPKTKKKRSRNGRTPQPNIAIQPCHHTYSDEDCRKQGLIPWEGQYEESELISVIPSRIVLQKHMRQKYFQIHPITGERRIVTAPGPTKLKEGSRYSLEFATEVGLCKYNWHLPLDRQVRMLSAEGLEITSGTLFELTDTVAWYLRPTVFKRIVDQIKQSPVNQADDTTWKNLEKLETREKSKFYLWAVMNKEAICFNIYDSRSQKTAKNFLGDLEGTLVSDGHSSFKALASDKLTLANDWFHVRRKFFEASKTYPEECRFFLDSIGALSKIEERLKGKPPDEILAVRQKESKPIIESIRKVMDSLGHILPQSSLGRALTYADKLWPGLLVFLNDGRVPMHTNDVERAMRQGAVGRKNHYGSKNLTTARVAAVWYTIVETCKLNGVNPRAYIIETLRNILEKKPYQMPWEFAAASQDGVDPSKNK